MIGWSQSEDDSTQRAQIQTDAIHHSRHSTNESETKKVPQKSSEMEFPDPKDWIPHPPSPSPHRVSQARSHWLSSLSRGQWSTLAHCKKLTFSQSKYVETTPGDLDIWTFIQPATIRSNPTHFHITQLSSQVQQNNFSFLDVGCDERLDEDIGGQNDESKSPVFLITGNKPCCYINLYYSEGETNNKTQTKMDYPTFPSSS